MTGGPTLLEGLVGDAETAALFTDEADLQAMLRAETALAEAQAEAGVLAPEAAAAIGAACAAFAPDWAGLARGMATDGVVVPALVAQLRAAVAEPHRAAVHGGATSQDIIDTSLVLRLADLVRLFEARLGRLDEALAAVAARDGARRLMGHTRMQAALPIAAADKVESWRAPLRRAAGRLRGLAPELLALQLGGPVGDRASLGPQAGRVAAAMAARLGLRDAPPWHTQRDSLACFGGWLSLVTGSLGKLGQDVALLAQTEVGAVRLAGTGTSSAMAHKHNPVAAEVLVALARFNAGMLGTLHQSLVHEYERSGAAWTLEWMVLPRMAMATGAALRLARSLVDGLAFT